MSEQNNAISEAASKKKRGRPRITSPEAEAQFMWLYPNITHRQRCNKIWQARGHNTIVSDPLFKWMFDPEKGIVHTSLLAELGRIDDDDERLRVATELSKLEPRPSIKQACAIVRRVRLGKAPKPTAKGLAYAMARAADQDEIPRTGITQAQIDQAIAILCKAFGRTVTAIAEKEGERTE